MCCDINLSWMHNIYSNCHFSHIPSTQWDETTFDHGFQVVQHSDTVYSIFPHTISSCNVAPLRTHGETLFCLTVYSTCMAEMTIKLTWSDLNRKQNKQKKNATPPLIGWVWRIASNSKIKAAEMNVSSPRWRKGMEWSVVMVSCWKQPTLSPWLEQSSYWGT